jgi:hypothetical protein
MAVVFLLMPLLLMAEEREEMPAGGTSKEPPADTPGKSEGETGRASGGET